MTVVLVLASGVTGAESFERLSPTVAMIAYALVLGAAALLYVAWHLSSVDLGARRNRHLTAWLVVGLTTAAVHGFQVASLQRAAQDEATRGMDGRILVSQIVVVLVLVLITRKSQRVGVSRDPAVVGILGGLGLAGSTYLLVAVAPAPPLGSVGGVLLGQALLLAGLVLALDLHQHVEASLWIRRRLAFAAGVLVAAQYAAHLVGPAATGFAVVATTVGVLTLSATAIRLLRRAATDYRTQLRALRSALDEQDAAVHEQRELLHELGSTLAGIASATEIIWHGPTLPRWRQDRLERLLEAEVGRLVRLMRLGAEFSEVETIDVDEVLGRLVLSHETRGADIRWRPSGVTVLGSADDLAEAVNILLENCSRHGYGAPVTLSAAPSGDGAGTVEIVCSDLGPGVPPEIRGRIFDHGFRGPESPGEGIGLAIARRLLRQHGGDLVLRPDGPGATFMAQMPARSSERETARVIAHAS